MYRIALLAISGLALACSVHAQPVKVEDFRGKIVELPAPAERIVVIPLPLPSVIMALDGSAKRLIGIQPSARKSIEDGFLKRVFPEALNIPKEIVRGGQFTPNIETILGLKPDLIVQWHQPPELVANLESAGLTAVALYNDPPTQLLLERNLTIIGEAIGRGDRVRALLGMHHAAQTKISAVTQSIPDHDRPRALYFREYGANLQVSGSENYRNYWITLAGGRNAGATLKGTNLSVNKEQIVLWNPEVIFLGAFDDSTPQMVVSAPELAGVDAVRNRRVYKVPHGGYRWDPGSHESFLTWQWAAMLLQPAKFNIDLRSEMRSSYEFFYNHKLDDTEIDQILQMELNRDSAGYERFAT